MREKTIKITQSYYLSKLKLILALSSAIITTSANNVLAQNITIDGTLSPAQTLNGPTYTIPQSVGQTVNSNLFHSFGQFSLNQGERANFQSNANIRNIFSRVTGGYPSNIDGLIFTQNRSVNLYLINPSGIVFGPNARLNVGGSTRGSFVATTADALVWSNGSQFSATNPGGTSSLLTIVGDPSGFLFSSRPPQPITVSGSQLSVYQGQSLLLLGGDVSLDNGQLSVDFTEGGRIELGAVAEPGTVGLTTNGNILSLSFPENLAQADVLLTQESFLDVTAGNGGSIAINARNIDILGGSQLRGGIGSELGNVDSQAGDVTLNATNAITFDRGDAFSNVEEGAVGNGGNIRITADSLSVTNGAQLITSSAGQGNAGNVIIDAQQVLFDGTDDEGFNSSAFSNVVEGAVGNGGEIRITADSLSITNGAQLITSSAGQGNAGNVIIDAQQVLFDGTDTEGFSSSAFSDVEEGAVGNGGEIRITANSLSVTNGAQLFASSAGQGNAGNVIINAQQVLFDGTDTEGFSSGVLSNVEEGAVGNGGNVRITANSLALTNGARINAFTRGQGNAGNVIIDAGEVSFDRSFIFSTVEQTAIGDGGDVRINANSLSITNGAQLLALTRGQGNAGNVIIDAGEVSFDRGSIFSTVEQIAIGDGGDVRITANSLALTNGARINAFTRGQGNAGNVIIDSGEVSFDRSFIFSTVEQTAIGDGGDVRITANSLALTNGAQINAFTGGQGNAGNVIIDAGEVSFDRGSIFSTVEQTAVGNGGEVRITANSLAFTNGTELNVSTRGQGNAGDVIIDAGEVSFNRGFIFSIVGQTAVGDSGNIRITADSLALTNGAQINAFTRGQGNAGNVIIDAGEVSFDRGSIFSTVEQTAIGDGGDVRINANSLSITNGAQLIAVSRGQGNAGNIQITALEAVDISGTDSIKEFSSGLFTSTTSNSTGKSGNITVNTNLFRLSDSAVLNARTRNNQNGGNITINASSFELLNAGQLVSTTSGRGSAGKITVNATEKVIVNGIDTTFSDRVARFGADIATVDAASGLFVRSDGLGSAGNIEVNSPFVLLDNGSRFIAESRSVNGGDISVNAGNALLLRRGSQISTTAGTAQAGGNGGNININAGFVIALPQENSNITANAFSGTGGQVQINTQGIFGIEPRLNDSINSSDITASSTTGINGDIIINTPNVDPTQGLTNLPADTVNTASLIDSACSASDDQTGSQFTVTGRGGLPASPDDVLNGDAVWSDTRLTVAAKPHNGSVSRVTTHQKSSNAISIVPATGWVFNNKGEVTLVSQVAKADAYNVGYNHVACGKP